MSFRFMCSFLLAFLVIIVFFTHLKDSAEYKYLSTQSSQTASTRSQRLVLVQKGSNFFDEVFIEKDPQNSQESSQPRPSIYCEYPRSHGFSPRRELGVLSVEVPMWAPKQEMGFSMCNLLWPLDGWCASQNATETVQLAGISMGRLARGFMEECCKSLNKQSHKLQKCGAKSFSASQGQSAKAYWPWQECWQREAEKQERNAPKQRTGNSANITVSGRRSRVCFLAFLGCLQVHADLRACTEPFCRDYSNLQQPRPGVDREFEESLSRSEYNARRYQVAHRESRPRAWTCRHKEPTPSHKIPWESQEHLAEVTEQRRAHRSQWMAHLAAGISMWESQLKDFRKHQTLLTDQANRARTEVTATNLIIQQLSSQAAGGTNPPNLPAPSPTEVEDLTEDAIDKEEDALRQKLQGVLKRCAGSLGLEISSSKPEEAMEEVEKEDAADKPPKRQRSLEPFATTPK